jgi:Domain of unknown function (DUF1996)
VALRDRRWTAAAVAAFHVRRPDDGAVPNCWDGVNLDSPDHRSHMAYPVGSRCPATHPVNIPRVESYFRFRITPGPLGEVFPSSGPWWTIHQDVFFSWVPSEIQRFTAGCIAVKLDCRQNPL